MQLFFISFAIVFLITSMIIEVIVFRMLCKKDTQAALKKLELIREEVELIETCADKHMLSMSASARDKLHDLGVIRTRLSELLQVATKSAAQDSLTDAATEILELGVDIPGKVLQKASKAVPYDIYTLKNWEQEFYDNSEAVLRELQRREDRYHTDTLSDDFDDEVRFAMAKALISELRERAG